ncbi:MAG: hypothetical protein WBG30_13570 [Psychrilyobacter sp.]|uniref:hypothetical protein n=1 Tax=Psychrilyobacter sp. TaxID=2586924 RepID=UPI003C7491A2
MKRLIIMLFLVVTSISFSIGGRHKAVVINGQKEYEVAIEVNLNRSDYDYSENEWDIASSTVLRNGSPVDYIKIKKNGPIKKGIVPIKLVVSSADSQKLLSGPLLQVIKAENIDLRIGSFRKTLNPQYFTFIKNIHEVIIKKIVEINLGTLHSGEELPKTLLPWKRLIEIKYNTNGPCGYTPMMDLNISGSGTSNNLKVEGGNFGYTNREITLINQRRNSNDQFNIKGTYAINFTSSGNGYIDLSINSIGGEYPTDYGKYKATETISITLY